MGKWFHKTVPKNLNKPRSKLPTGILDLFQILDNKSVSVKMHEYDFCMLETSWDCLFAILASWKMMRIVSWNSLTQTIWEKEILSYETAYGNCPSNADKPASEGASLTGLIW